MEKKLAIAPRYVYICRYTRFGSFDYSRNWRRSNLDSAYGRISSRYTKVLREGHQLKLNTKTNNGFTIVELLIVVVVIAILAAITIVAYNGIQTRAKNTQQVSAVNDYIKGIKAYQASKGTVPWFGIACFDGTVCWGGTDTVTGEAMRAELKTVMGPTLPNLPFVALLASGTTGDTPNGGNYTGYYVLYQHSDTGSCMPVGSARFLNTSWGSGMRTCRVAVE